MDKRRYVSRSPRNPREPKGIAAEETGNAAADGYTARYRKPLDRHNSFGRYGDDYACHGLKDETEAMFSKVYGDD